MSDVLIRPEGCAGRITLNRPDALNALTWDMLTQIEAAIDAWRNDPHITLLLIDGAGDKAFCAGGDIAEMYRTAKAGDYEYGRGFWRDEYRLNAKLFHFPKPVVTFLHGFTMGGGVGIGCHGSHRIVGNSSKIAMPECSIGLVPDVGGSLLLAQAPGRLGEYLGLTGDRMDAGDAIYAEFADYHLPEDQWAELKTQLCAGADIAQIDAIAAAPPQSRLSAWQTDIDAVFGGEHLRDIVNAVKIPPAPAIAHALKLMDQNAPLSMAVTLNIVRRVRQRPAIENALDQEYRFTSRAAKHGDFIEGIRAAIIDRDRNPSWQHDNWHDVPGRDIVRMTLPHDDSAFQLTGDRT